MQHSIYLQIPPSLWCSLGLVQVLLLFGFLQERAYQALAGRPVAKSILFFGCRKPKEDFLYSTSDLKKWVDLGVVDVRPAFSRSEGDSLECKYVQESVLFLIVIMNNLSHLHL